MRSLSEVEQGKTVKISSIDGDRRFLGRITAVGLTIGSDLKVIKNQSKQPVLVFIRDTMLAINCCDCNKIFVEVRVDEQCEYCTFGTA